MTRPLLTRARLLELLEYDPATGRFFWLVSQGTRSAGSEAGNHRSDGYIYIKIDRVLYRKTRLIWLYVHGHWPINHIDHINGKTWDDRLINLRDATRSENLGNRKRNKNNTSGFKGVHRRGNSFRAYINHNGTRFHLGCFSSAVEAHAVYCAKATELFGEFARFS